MRVFATLQAKDLDALMKLFADDAVVIDPHFPARRLNGKAAIEEGFQRAISQMQSFGYTVLNYCESENAKCAAVETATHHVARRGIKLNFPQTFIVEAENGHIKRLQAYEPYGPHGLMGFILFLVRLKGRFARK